MAVLRPVSMVTACAAAPAIRFANARSSRDVRHHLVADLDPDHVVGHDLR